MFERLGVERGFKVVIMAESLDGSRISFCRLRIGRFEGGDCFRDWTVSGEVGCR